MARRNSIALLRDIQTLFDGGSVAGLTDRQLLAQFAAGRDTSAEAAFEVLVRRHGPMVLRVCRNALRDPNDVQDAFQATFLVLVRRYSSVRQLESLGGWLNGVAYRVALRARSESARRRVVEGRAALRVLEVEEPSASAQSDLEAFRVVVDEVVQALPEKYRAVVVLCYWEGLTHDQAAIQLGLPLGTVRSRIARARDLLRRRLMRRGVTSVPGAMVGMLDAVLACPPLAIPNIMLRSTISASTQLASGLLLSDVSTATVAVLVRSTLRSFIMMKLRTIAICWMFIGTGVVGAILASQSDADRGARAPRGNTRSMASKAQPPLHPLASYVVEPPDLLIVEVLEALPGRPISGERLVRPDGKISLGFYGELDVAGLTPIEIKEKVVIHLKKFLGEETLGLVENDGESIAIDSNGQSRTKESKRIAPRDSDRVFVDVTAYNSKVYYIQGAVNEPGRIPCTGGETILDAVNFAGGLLPEADRAHVILYRKEKGGSLKRLPIDIDQITMGDDLSTNYQLEPGDRLVVPHLGKAESDGSNAASNVSRSKMLKRDGRSLYFNRRSEEADRYPRAVSRQPAIERDDQDDSRNLQRRLVEVERKLDKILEALKSPRP